MKQMTRKAVMLACALLVLAGAVAAWILLLPDSEETEHVHHYAAEVVGPACEEGGYTLYTCACGDSYQSDETEPAGHVFYDDGVYTAPFCETEGTLVYACHTCGHELVAETFPALGHDWGEWEVTLEPTEDSVGERQRSCSVCGEIETAEIAMLPEAGHEHNYEKTTVEATCTAAGYHVYTCACGDSYKGETLAASGHAWSHWTVTKEATTTTTGTAERVCATCGEVETDTIPMKDPDVHYHSYTTVWVDATCTEGGYNLHTCSCGSSYRSDSVAALGHSYGAWEIIVEPTTSSTGTKRCVCETCGDVKTETVPALDPDTGDAYESYIDPRIKITVLRRSTVYQYGDCQVCDYRTWGDAPSIWVNEDGSLTAVYYQQDGARVDVHILVPNEGYIRSCSILDDGTYSLGVIGGLS